MKTNVRAYTDKELLNRVCRLSNFKNIPAEYWVLGVRSNEDGPDGFDDKGYLYRGPTCISVFSMTTNPGTKSLKGYKSYNPLGSAIMASDMWHHDIWSYGLHRGKMPALKQVNECYYYRDGDMDVKSEELGSLRKGLIGLNFHTATYTKNMNFIRRFIGGWSAGCQVLNFTSMYYSVIKKVKHQKYVSYCLINEF